RRPGRSGAATVSGGSLRHLLAGPRDGAKDARMRAATAEIAGERLPHLAVAGLRIALQQGRRRHDHAVDAIAALRRLLVDEGLLDGMRLVDGAETLDGGDLLARRQGDREGAGAHRLAVDDHRAGAALSETAAEFCAVQLEVVAQHIEEGGIFLRVHPVPGAVDGELDGIGHGLPPAIAYASVNGSGRARQ